MEKERISRVLSLALNTEQLRSDSSPRRNLEINIDYGRTMSAIIFERRAAAYHAAADGTLLDAAAAVGRYDSQASLAAAAKRRPVPELACVDIPSHDCLDNKKGFAFQTFLSKPEIITCIHKCKTECNKVLNLSLYTTGYTKSLTDEKFKTLKRWGSPLL